MLPSWVSRRVSNMQEQHYTVAFHLTLQSHTTTEIHLCQFWNITPWSFHAVDGFFFQLKICSVAWSLRNFGHKYLATFSVCIWFAHIIIITAVQTMEFTFVFYHIHTMVCSLYLYYTGHNGSKSIQLQSDMINYDL
jgi:hypothetical protein